MSKDLRPLHIKVPIVYTLTKIHHGQSLESWSYLSHATSLYLVQDMSN